MQETLYPLSNGDIEAIGKSRANRSLRSNVKWWLYGGFLVCLAGFAYGALMGGNTIVVVVIIALGAVGIWYSSVLKDRISKRLIRQLKDDWRKEEK